MQNQLKNELHHIISGEGKVRFGTVIQSITSYLNNGSPTSAETENTKQFKEQETKRLEGYASQNNLLITGLDFSQYVSEGAEQKVYLKDADHVIKLNDAIYYSSWRDYLYNLLLHNFFFPDTAYNLKGFTKDGLVLYAVVEQSYVATTESTDLNDVKLFLTSNGFENVRNNDYQNPEIGIILEDLHDENVLTKNSILYFIDTVFYITDRFWQ